MSLMITNERERKRERERVITQTMSKHTTFITNIFLRQELNSTLQNND